MTEATSGPRRPPEEPVTPPGPPRPVAVTGLVGAVWCVGIGLTLLTTITLAGWIAAPRAALGPGLPGVFRTAVNLWLVAHHAGFSVPQGRVGLLPLGLMVLPGALLYRSGGWIVRVSEMPGRQRTGVAHTAIALAAPYSILAGLLALAARSTVVQPSAWQTLPVCFLLALCAGGLGAARAMVALRGKGEGKRVRSGLGALLRLLPDRPRSLVMGVVGSVTVLIISGALLAGVSLALHLADAKAMYAMLAPGLIGGILLFLLELVFVPNAVIWAMCYAIGPGFAVGDGTSVSPTGVFLNIIPSFPPLAALPEAGPAPALSLLALAAPFIAGAVGGVLTIRAMPSPVDEAAPLWGFLSGALTGLVTAVLAALSGGPLGGGRLATMGPSAWKIGLMATLEVGVSAAIAAWIANWLLLRRPARPGAERRIGHRSARRSARRSAGGATRSTGRTAARPLPPEARGPRPATGPGARAAGAGPAAGSGPAAGTERGTKRGTAGQPVRPYLNDPVEFVDPEPVLAVRRPPRRSPAVPPPPDGAAAPAPGKVHDVHEVPVADDADAHEAYAAQQMREAPAGPGDRGDREDQGHRHDEVHGPERSGDPQIERRSGALYVLRNDRPGHGSDQPEPGPDEPAPDEPGP